MYSPQKLEGIKSPPIDCGRIPSLSPLFLPLRYFLEIRKPEVRSSPFRRAPSPKAIVANWMTPSSGISVGKLVDTIARKDRVR